MKIKISKDEIKIESAQENQSLCQLVKDCIDGFIKIQESNNVVSSPKVYEKETTNLIRLPQYEEEIIRERLPNDIDDIDEINSNTIDLKDMNTKQLPIRQYKNFMCRKCGQSSLIKTLGELQSICFRAEEPNKDDTKILLLNLTIASNLISKYEVSDIKIPLSQFIINATKEDDENYIEGLIEDIDVAITTDGTLECECPCCGNTDNFNAFYNTFKKHEKYFDYKPCTLCGSETSIVIQQDKQLIECENENCKFQMELKTED